jgi:hypothetical protein
LGTAGKPFFTRSSVLALSGLKFLVGARECTFWPFSSKMVFMREALLARVVRWKAAAFQKSKIYFVLRLFGDGILPLAATYVFAGPSLHEPVQAGWRATRSVVSGALR